MAIIKSRPTPFGISAEYHRIERVDINSYEKTINIQVAVYPNSEARQSNSKPLTIETISIPFWRLNSDPRSTFYELLSAFEQNNPVAGGVGDVNITEEFPKFIVAPWVPTPMPPTPMTITPG